MATTKIFPITATVGQAITYIAASAKTDNGRLISTYLCSRIPDKAAKEFAEVTATGTGRSKVLAQHFIMAFKPGEVTPERAMEIGKEMCEKYLKDQYMSVEGVSCVLNRPDMRCKSGYRDSLILTLLYDSGARVTEVTKIRIGDIRTEHPATIVLHGKGSKDRIVPLSSKTADLVSSYLSQSGMIEAQYKDKFLFTNRTGQQLTRAGVAYILKKYVDAARGDHPELIPDRFSPHCMHHSKAMHLLQAGVAIIYIRDFLGHESIKTTEVYAKADGKSKREALDVAYSAAIDDSNVPKVSWNNDDALMTFLKRLCDG